MDINAELELVKDFDNSSKFINEPGVFIVKIKSYLLSESRKDYKGNPYIILFSNFSQNISHFYFKNSNNLLGHHP